LVRAASAVRGELRRDNPDLRVGIINNPILSPASAQAAKVDLAVLTLSGAKASYALHQRLFASAGRIDGPRALDAAAALGGDRAAIERVADGPEVADTLGRQMRLAASLGVAATPSYVVGGAVLLGFPGRRALADAIADTRRCGGVVCGS
jgi:protein-disulfide isomerase